MNGSIIRNANIMLNGKHAPTLLDFGNMCIIDQHADKHETHALVWDYNTDNFIIAVDCVVNEIGEVIFELDSAMKSSLGFGNCYVEGIACKDAIEFDSRPDAMRRWVDICNGFSPYGNTDLDTVTCPICGEQETVDGKPEWSLHHHDEIDVVHHCPNGHVWRAVYGLDRIESPSVVRYEIRWRMNSGADKTIEYDNIDDARSDYLFFLEGLHGENDSVKPRGVELVTVCDSSERTIEGVFRFEMKEN